MPLLTPRNRLFPPKSITLIRHAQSIGNAYLEATHLSSQFATPIAPLVSSLLYNTRLSQLGIKQAKALSDSRHSYDLVVLSPLRRVIQTYAYSNILTRNLIISNLFRERILDDTDIESVLDNETPVQETDREFLFRVAESRRFLLSRPEQNICVVSHEIFMVEFLNRQLLTIPNCSVQKCRLDGNNVEIL